MFVDTCITAIAQVGKTVESEIDDVVKDQVNINYC